MTILYSHSVSLSFELDFNLTSKPLVLGLDLVLAGSGLGLDTSGLDLYPSLCGFLLGSPVSSHLLKKMLGEPAW